MLRSLQAGRAVAALMVLCFHLGLAIKHYFGVDLFLVPFGHAGVDFFFVLSGFIISLAHRGDIHQPRQFGRFIWKRFARVYPIYWIVFLVAYAGAYRIVDLSPGDLVWALLLIPANSAPVVSVAWSLQWEVVFYGLFGALILHPILGLAALAAVLLCWPYGTVYLALFLAGALSALVDQWRPTLPGRTVALLGAAIFISACVYDVAMGHKPTLWLGLGSAVLVLGLVSAERAGHVFGRHPALQLLGDSSYCIYLVHYPVISAACKAAMWLGLRGQTWGWLLYPVMLSGAVLAGVALHRLIEKPLLGRLNKDRH
ncbi:MAG: acyltransferase family protein [Roseateles sp.]|uniref:acyltransferase family protein n=1 Tax=Roseateles sp. TaxID=1971397 RepID=UPI0040359118